jgi:FixJ family two-component response regulator
VSARTLPTVLLVDDDLALLEGLRRRLRRSFDVHLAADGEAALAALRTLPQCSVVVADMLMPGMKGTELLARVREMNPDVVRVLLTGYADVDAAIAAVNHAGTFRFLCKPCRASELRETLEDAVRQHELVLAERELLEQTLRGTIRALSEALALSHPKAFAHTVRRAEIVSLLVADLPEAEKWAIDVAAMLADVGVVTLPPEVVDKLYGGNPLTPQEQVMVDRLPRRACSVRSPDSTGCSRSCGTRSAATTAPTVPRARSATRSRSAHACSSWPATSRRSSRAVAGRASSRSSSCAAAPVRTTWRWWRSSPGRGRPRGGRGSWRSTSVRSTTSRSGRCSPVTWSRWTASSSPHAGSP